MDCETGQVLWHSVDGRLTVLTLTLRATYLTLVRESLVPRHRCARAELMDAQKNVLNQNLHVDQFVEDPEKPTPSLFCPN